MADKNLNNYLQAVRDSNGRVVGTALRSVGGATRPTDADLSAGTLFWNTGSTALDLFNGTTWLTVATAAGAGGVTTWDELYTNDKTLAINDTTLTITVSAAVAGLTFNKTNGGAGAVMAITNSGTGDDITGNASNWTISATGAARFVAIAMDDNELITLGTGSDATIGWNGTVLNIAGVTDFDNNITMAASATITQTGVAGSAVYTITAGDVVWSDSSLLLTDADNAESVTIINNTATTIGAAASAGVVQVESTSLTTGAAVNVQLTEGTLAGGFYYSAWDATAGARVFSIGEDGAIAVTGLAGSNMLTLTAGDAVLSDGSLTMTDADNAATVSVTNNTSTTANTFLFTGSGVFTGTGTTAFFRVTQSGATSGDVVNVQTDGLTSGTAVRIGSTGTIVTTGALLEMVADSATSAAGLVRLTADALTTGFGALIESTSVNLAAGQLLNLDHTASGTIVAKTGQLIDIVSSRDNTAVAAISDDYDAVSIIRTNINTTAGGTLNAAGSVLRLEKIGTQTDGTLADTVIGLEVVMTGGTTQDGVGISLTHTGTTAGRAMLFTLSHTSLDGVIQVTGNSVDSGRLIVADCNALTSGIGVEVTHTTTVITTGSVMRLTSTGVDTGTGQGTLLDLVSSGTTAATVVSLVSDALATGIGIFASFDGLTTGEGVSITHTTSVIADGGSLFRLSSTGIDTGGATNGALLDLSSTAQATGVVARLACNGLTTGTGFLVTSSGTITSAGEGLVNIVGTGVTTGFGLKIDLTEATLTTGLYVNCYDDTGAESVFTVAENGVTTILGADGSASLTVSNGDLVLSDGAYASAVETLAELGAGATTFAVDSNVVIVDGEAGGNTISTITGGVAGQLLTLIFTDALVTITDTDTHAADTVDLVGASTTFADDATLTLVYAGGSWYEVSRSIND